MSKTSMGSILVACLGFLLGCSAKPGAIDVPESVPPDRSLTVAEYTQLGVPPIDRVWTVDDLSKAAEVLAGVAEKNRGQLPRYGSANSGPLFQRMTATDYLDQYLDDAKPVGERLLQANMYLGALPQVMDLYIAAYRESTASSTEMVEVADSQARVASCLLTLSDQLSQSVDQSQPGATERMEQISDMKSKLALVYMTTMRALGETKIHSLPDRRRLLSSFAKTLPETLAHLPEDQRTLAKMLLRSYVKAPDQQALARELESLLQVVESASR